MDSSDNFYENLKTDLLGLAGGAGIGAGISSFGSNSALKLINRYTDQTHPIGELFASYAPKVTGLTSGGETLSYTPLYPRTPSDLFPDNKVKGFLLDILGPLGSVDEIASLDNPEWAHQYPAEAQQALKDALGPSMQEAVLNEVIKATPPDKLTKYPELIDRLRAVKSDADVMSVVDDLVSKELPLEGVHTKHLLKVPRNNTLTMAHEIGHVMEKLEREKSLNTGSPLWRNIKKGLNDVYEQVGIRTLSDSTLVPHSIRNAFNTYVNSKNPFAQTLIHSAVGMLGTPLTAAVAPFTMSKTVRDFVSDLDESGNAKKVMDWIGDNATTVSALASAPLVIHEIATTPPGYKMTVDFWKEFNKGFDGALKDSPLLRESAALIGKKKPWLEGLKFLGQNALRFVPAFAPVIATAISSSINKSRKEEDTL